MKNWLEKTMNRKWSYWTGAVFLALLNVLIFIIQQRPWGVTSIIEAWTRWFGHRVGFLRGGETFSQLILNPATYVISGIILGSFLSVLVSSQGRIRPVRNKKYIISALIGGLLMGYGARIAYGCNIGAFLNGISSASLAGWVFGIVVFLGALIGGKLLLKFIA